MTRDIIIREVTLSDNSKVYDVIIAGYVELNCETLDKAVKLQSKLLRAIDEFSTALSYPATDAGQVIG